MPPCDKAMKAAQDAVGRPTHRTEEALRRDIATAIDEAVAAEREACAEVAETRFADAGYHPAARNAAIGIAAAIRARKP